VTLLASVPRPAHATSRETAMIAIASRGWPV